jgi:hypothetical protein
MEQILDIIKLTAKTALFFAHCDGEYSQRERDFVEGYLAGIEQFGDVPEELKTDVRDTLNHQYELYPLLAETKGLIDDFTLYEKAAVLHTIDEFVQQVIKADGEERKSERENYAQWKRELGIES